MTPKRPKIQARYFHIVGAGCFGSEYAHWLLRARQLGWLEFEKIIAIDRHASPKLAEWKFEHPKEAQGLEIIQEDWIAYFSNYLQKSFRDPEAIADHWVPSPISPHILFLGFLRAAEAMHPTGRFVEIPFEGNLKVPVQIPLQNGNLAVSFAEWECPIHCIEPETCPAIHAERTWDMLPALTSYFQSQGAQCSAHVLQCRHLVHGVGTIPCEKIFSAFKKLLQDLQSQMCGEVALATVSACHGLIGRAQVVSAEAKSDNP